MPYGKRPSWSMRCAIWDLYAKIGRQPEVILRDVDRLIEPEKPLSGECAPDRRTVASIIDDLQTLPVSIVRLLPPHIQEKRNDWPAIERQLDEPPNTVLIVALREIGSQVPIPEERTSGILVAFTLGNDLPSVLVVESICLEVLSYGAFKLGPTIGVRLTLYQYRVTLKPALGEYLVTKERFKYAQGDAEDFEVVCTSPDGVKYNLQLNAHCRYLSTGEKFIKHSDRFDICFPKKGGSRPGLTLRE